MTEPSQVRKNIREVLEVIASEERQLDYERAVPHVDITRELVSLWFDQDYHPEDPLLPLAFLPGELAALAEFHRFYDARADSLPESQGTVRTWLASPLWREIMSQAQRALQKVPNSEGSAAP